MGWLDSPIAFAKGVGRVLLKLLLLPFRIPKRVFRTLTGLRGTSPATKALTLVAVALAGVAGAGLFFATQANMEVSTSSAPVVSAVLEWMTNGWGYVLAALVFGRGTVWGIRHSRIRLAARESGYGPRTIARLADEIRTTDGAARAIIFGDDTFDEARQRILETFDGEDDRIYLGDAATDAVDDVEEPHEGTVEERSAAVEADAPDDAPALEPADETFDFGDALGEAVTQPPEAESTDDEELPPEQPPTDPEQTAEAEPTNAERFKLWRMDLATALRTDDVVWKLLVPTAVVFVLELILVQFWVQWWLYPSLLAAAFVIGLGVYKGDQWRRRRRLDSLRKERGGETWEEIAVLVKTVEADELTVHMGFLAGRSYASTDREQLAATLASRALERSHGYHPSPAIEERYAWCLDRYIVNFAGWRENMEKPAVMDHLVNEVLDSGEGILPKEVLAERVVEHDRRYIWQGMRFVGLGYDPDLVAECYEELVPNTLVEHDLELAAPGGRREMTAVRARTESLPPDVAQLRANFSERFPVRKLPERYDLPAVEPDEATRGFAMPAD